MKKNKRVVVLLSGGADSVVVYQKLKEEGYKIYPLFVDYFQPNLWVEKEVATKVAPKLKSRIVELSKVMTRGCRSDKQAFVPHRNSIFLLMAANYAEEVKADAIAIGYMKQDVSFFDNSLVHHQMIEQLVKRNLGRDFKVLTPIQDFTKKDVMRFLQLRNLPSVSCWNAKYYPGTERIVVCERCANCKERMKAEKEIRRENLKYSR